jgi:hypothetical protein
VENNNKKNPQIIEKKKYLNNKEQDTKIQIQEAQQTERNTNTKTSTARHNLFKLHKMETFKEKKILEQDRKV